MSILLTLMPHVFQWKWPQRLVTSPFPYTQMYTINQFPSVDWKFYVSLLFRLFCYRIVVNGVYDVSFGICRSCAIHIYTLSRQLNHFTVNKHTRTHTRTHAGTVCSQSQSIHVNVAFQAKCRGFNIQNMHCNSLV